MEACSGPPSIPFLEHVGRGDAGASVRWTCRTTRATLDYRLVVTSALAAVMNETAE